MKKKHFNYGYHQPLLLHLQKLQLFGDSYRGKAYQQFEQDQFTPYQKRLYKDAVYGLSSYGLEELRSMSIRDKLAIKQTHRLAQHILNQWKQEIVTKLVDEFLLSVFYRSQTVKKLVDYSGDYFNLKEINHFEFSELNLSKVDIALKLVKEKILPEDFFRLAA